MSVRIPRLTAPQGFGSLGGQPIRQTDIQPQQVANPDQVRSQMQNALPELPKLPDFVVAMQGPVTKDNVGRLLATVAGSESGWQGVTPDMATRRLQALKMPVNANDWTPDQWAAAIAAEEAKPNALAMLGY